MLIKDFDSIKVKFGDDNKRLEKYRDKKKNSDKPKYISIFSDEGKWIQEKANIRKYGMINILKNSGSNNKINF